MIFVTTNSNPSKLRARLVTSLLLLLTMAFSPLFAEQIKSTEITSQNSPLADETRQPMAMAQKNLEQAQKNFKQGDMEAVVANLQDAKKWLENSQSSKNTKSNEEAKKLTGEIADLEKQMSHSSDQNEGILSRLWHRSTALVEHEIESVTRQWNEASTASEAYKHILDARLHFDYAEHELFISQDRNNAEQELKQTLNYLDEAKKVANPEAAQQIALIVAKIRTLDETPENQTENKELFAALASARLTLLHANKNNGPLIDSELKNIIHQIEAMKNNLGNLMNRQHYQAIMHQLHQLDSVL